MSKPGLDGLGAKMAVSDRAAAADLDQFAQAPAVSQQTANTVVLSSLNHGNHYE
jgi:hypothetical protein